MGAIQDRRIGGSRPAPVTPRKPLHNTVDNLPDFVDNLFGSVDNPPLNYT